MQKKWIPGPLPSETLGIAGEFGIHPILASLLARRGLTDFDTIRRFLEPSFDHLKSPFEFGGMQKAIGRIHEAIAKKERVVVYGDYDVDGITGSAILFPVLKRLGANVAVHIPDRMREGYGLNQESVERLLHDKMRLLITVDNGITGAGPIGFLREKGVDTIVVDHHLPKDSLPPAYAIVSAAMPGSTGDENLAACGLAFKLAWALTGDFESVKDLIDLVTVGTVADLAPVLGENRVFLKLGLPLLAKTRRVGLRALMESAQLSPQFLSYRDIAFGLGPRINAAGRMGSPMNAFKLLVTENADEAQNLAKILEAGNRDRQRVETTAFEEALEVVEAERLMSLDPVVVVASDQWHEGVLGILASRLVERYHRPSIVIALRESKGKGSGRSLPGVSLFNLVQQTEEFLDTFGGHAQAVGLTIQKDNIPRFRNRLNEVAKNNQTTQWEASLGIDGELGLEDLSQKFILDLEKLSPYGPGNPKPYFLSKSVKVRGQVRRRGKDTLHGWVTGKDGKSTCQIVGFRSFERWQTTAQKDTIDIVYHPCLKNYQGISSIELELADWR